MCVLYIIFKYRVLTISCKKKSASIYELRMRDNVMRIYNTVIIDPIPSLIEDVFSLRTYFSGTSRVLNNAYWFFAPRRRHSSSEG